MNFIRLMDPLQDGEKALLEKRSHLRLKVLSWLENQLPTIKPRLGLKDICNDNVFELFCQELPTKTTCKMLSLSHFISSFSKILICSL